MSLYNSTNNKAIEICNKALLLAGIDTINTLEDESAEAKACSMHIIPTIDEILSRCMFSFSKIELDGDISFGEHKDDCSHIYILAKLPGNIYIWRVPIVELPEYVIDCIVYKLSSILALSVGNNLSWSNVLNSQAEFKINTARTLDARSRPVNGFKNNRYAKQYNPI